MLITIDRQWSNTIGTDEDGTPGWICWIKVWNDGADFGYSEFLVEIWINHFFRIAGISLTDARDVSKLVALKKQ